MKLAEALIQRADMQAKINTLQSRVAENATVQEGETPQEDPNELLEQLTELVYALSDLVIQINHTNANTMLGKPWNMTMTAALARREAYKRHQFVLEQAAKNATIRRPRFGRMEIKEEATLDVAQLRKDAERIQEQIRALDLAIQQQNWTTDLQN